MLGIDIFAALAEICCMCLVLSGFFKVQRRKWAAGIVTLVCSGAYCWLSIFAVELSWLMRTILAVLAWFCVSVGAFEGSRIKKLFVVISFWAVACAIDLAVWAASTYIPHWDTDTALTQTANYLLAALCSRTLLFVVSFVCSMIVRRQKKSRKTFGIIWLCLVLVPGYTLFGIGTLLEYSIRNGRLSSGTVALCVGLFAINVVLLLLMNYLEQSRIVQQENIELQHIADLNLGKARAYMESYRQQRAITHEFDNQLSVLKSLLEADQVEKAASYIGEIRKQSAMKEHPVSTNNPILDAIINQKYGQAKQHGVTMELMINDMSAFPMEEADMVTLIGNLLDNAIHAARQTEGEKHIWCRLRQDRSFVTLTIRNTCAEETAEAARSGQEDEPALHGFGLQNIERVLQKYQYDYHMEKADGIFSFSAILG